MNTLACNLIFVSSQSVIIMLRDEGCLSDTMNSYSIFVALALIPNILVFTPRTLPPIRMIPQRFGETVKYLPNSFSYSQNKHLNCNNKPYSIPFSTPLLQKKTQQLYQKHKPLEHVISHVLVCYADVNFHPIKLNVLIKQNKYFCRTNCQKM